MSACAAVLAAGLLLAAADAPVRVMVLVESNDGAEAGRMQSEVEKRIFERATRVKVAPSATLAAALGAPAPEPVPTPQAVEEARKAIEIAIQGFLQSELTRARESAEAAKNVLLGHGEVAHEQLVRASLWLALIHAQNGDDAAAARELGTLLGTIDPTAKPGAEFPPDFIAQVDRERQKLSTVPITLDGVPSGAQIIVNGRRTEGPRFLVLKDQPTRIDVRAAGFRSATVNIPGKAAPHTERVPLALALTKERGAAVKAALDGRADPAQLEPLLQAAGVDALVLVRKPRAVLWQRKEEPRSLPAGSADQLVSALVGVYDRSRRGPPPSLAATGGVEISAWNRDVGDLYTLPLSGTGPRIAFDGGWRGVLAAAEASFVTYSLTPIEVNVSGGSTGSHVAEGEGGSAFRASLGVGYGLSLGAVRLGALVGGRHESYSMTPVKVTQEPGEKRAMIASHAWTAPELRLRAEYHLGRLQLGGSAGAALPGTYRETPDGVSGKEPKPGLAPFWQVGATMPVGKMLLGLRYAGELRTVTYLGGTLVDYDGNDDRDVVQTDLLSSFALTAAWRFGATSGR